MIEINIRLDFSSGNVFPDGNNLGHVGEHNATILTVTPPPEMAANENIAFYCLAFEVGNDFIKKIVRSALIPKADTFEVKLWQQVTIGENIKIQLEAYDTENSLLIKTDYADAALSPSVNGVQSGTDTSGQSLAGTVAAHEAKLSRPTVTVEAIGELAMAARMDMTSFEGLAIGACTGDYLYDKVPLGAEIKTIEFRLEGQDEWIDIHRMHEYDGIPCVINMVYVSDGTYHGVYDKLFALITPAAYSVTNFLHDAMSGNQNGDIRITYYTDNIGGENNA